MPALHHEAAEKAEHEAEEWQAAMEALILVATSGGPTMFARIGVMRALNRHVEHVFDPSRKDKQTSDARKSGLKPHPKPFGRASRRNNGFPPPNAFSGPAMRGTSRNRKIGPQPRRKLFGELARFTDGFLRLSAVSDPECAETGLVCDKNCSTVARLFYRVRAFKLAPTVRRTGASDD